MVKIACKIITTRWLCILAAAGLTSSFAAEKIEITGGSKLELPKQGRQVDELSPSLGITPEKPDVNGGFIMPPSATPAPLDKKVLDAIDKKQNWIFRNPYEIDKEASGLEMLEKEDSSKKKLGIESDKDNQTVFERYLKEKERRQEQQLELARDRKRMELKNNDNPFQDFRNREMDLRDPDDAEFSRELSLKSYLQPGDLQNRLKSLRESENRNAIGFKPLVDRPLPDPQELKKQNEVRTAEFQKLLQPKNLVPSISGMVDPLQSQMDPTRIEVNPITPGRSADQALSFGRGDSSLGSKPARAPVDLRGAASTERFSAGLPGASISAPGGLSSTPAVAPSAVPSFTPSPFSLEIPRRKF